MIASMGVPVAESSADFPASSILFQILLVAVTTRKFVFLRHGCGCGAVVDRHYNLALKVIIESALLRHNEIGFALYSGMCATLMMQSRVRHSGAIALPHLND